MSVDEVLEAQDTDRESGLRNAVAQARLEEYGANRLVAAAPTPWWRQLLAQFESALVLMLLVATLISFAIWLVERPTALPFEALAIFAIVLLNALMGFVQQARAERSVAALKEMSATQAVVIRDGARRTLPAEALVPGDIILIEEGDAVAADARLLDAVNLQTQEAALTGESLPVSKSAGVLDGDRALADRSNMIWSGTSAVSGHGRAVVTATGMRTEMGGIAGLLEATPDEATPLERELQALGRMLGGIVLVIAAVIIATVVFAQDVSGLAGFVDVLILGVALAVAAVPEGLPAIVTAVLSRGMQRMAKRNAIVRRLSAVESLGSVTIIAADKTGTLTGNQMTVRRVVTASGSLVFGGTGYEPAGEVTDEDGQTPAGPLRTELFRVLTAGELACNASLRADDGSWTVDGDPTEGALVVAARKAGLDSAELHARYERIGEVPFSSERKRMSTLHRDAADPERLFLVTKGAPDVLLDHCTRELVGDEPRALSDERREEIAGVNEQLAGQALRTLAVAWRSLPAAGLDDGGPGEGLERDLVFLGLVGMLDPPREEAKSAIARAAEAGIRTIMITGDHPATAAVIAKELGIADDGRAVTGDDFLRMSDDERDRTLAEVSVYARVNPAHKLSIVDALQRSGEVVAMTGDGVNDAPALKSADVGIAMGLAGTDVSREAADIVLADDNYASIVAAVEEGRAIYANIRKFLRYLLGTNLGEVMMMFFGVLLAGFIGLASGGDGLALPLLATQILWVNLVTDGAPALALGVDPVHAGSMQRPPRPGDERILTRRMWLRIVQVGAVMAAGCLLVLDASLPGGLIEGSHGLRHAQTMTFTTLVFFSLFNVFNVRSDHRSAFEGLFGNRWIWAAILVSLALQAAVVHLPVLQQAFSTAALGVNDWLICAAVGSSVLWLRELTKFAGRSRISRGAPRG